jgi:hypothetical protein
MERGSVKVFLSLLAVLVSAETITDTALFGRKQLDLLRRSFAVRT